MEKTKRMVVVLVAVTALVSIVPMPTQAVTADCSDEKQMGKGDPGADETLPSQSVITWSVSIAASEAREVHIQLRSLASILDYGVFLDDSGTCTPADDLTAMDCGDAEQIETTSLKLPPQTDICVLEAPSSGTFTYFFHLVNNQQTGLQYRTWYEDI